MPIRATRLPCVVSDVVSDEVAVAPGRITWLSTAEGPDRWADAVLNAPPRTRETLTRVEQSPLSIDNSCESLVEVYQRGTLADR